MSETVRSQLQGPLFVGGLNDTDLPVLRKDNEARAQINCRVRPDGALEKLKGRESAITGFAGEITGIIVPLSDYPLATLTSINKTLGVHGGSAHGDYTVNLVEGNYYTYAELAAALHTALHTITGTATWDVTYDSGTGLFTIASDYHFRLNWGVVATTLDPRLFGFDFSVEDSAAPYTVSSVFAVTELPPRKRMFATPTALYDEDKTEIKFPSGASADPSAEKWSGIWNNKRWYGSNKNGVYIIRDGNYLRRQLDNNQAQTPVVEKYTTQANIYDISSEVASLVLNKDIRWARLTIPTLASPLVPYYVALSKIVFGAPYDYRIRIYYEIPAYGYRQLIQQRSPSAITSLVISVGSELSSPIMLTNGVTQHFLIEFVPLKENAVGTFTVKGAATEVNTLLIDSNGMMQTGPVKWAGLIAHLNWPHIPVNYVLRYRTSLVNKEGYETELSDVGSVTLTGGPAECNVKITFGAMPAKDYDWEFMKIHHTLGNGGTVYYELTKIPRKIFENCSYPMVLIINQVESLGFSTPESDVFTSRSPAPAWTTCAYWQSRMWTLGNDDTPNTAFWSRAGMPESNDLAYQWAPVGTDGSRLRALCALGDKLLTFNDTAFGFFYMAGDMPNKSDISQFGIGTLSPLSPVAVFTEEGAMCLFQGSDGHFYLTDGLRLVCISRGRLDNFVAGLNPAALDRTIGIWNVNDHEVLWSVCTGSAVKPNKTVAYDYKRNIFYLETASADLWVLDRIRAGSINNNLILGVQNQAAFYWRNANADLGAVIAAEYETADLCFGDPEGIKNFVLDEISVIGANAAQQLTLQWFLNELAVAEGNKVLTLATSAARQNFNISGRAKRIRYRLTNSDSLGQWAVGHILTEFAPILDLRRGE